MKRLTETECRDAIAQGDFSESVRFAADRVVIILTQSWCPQWRFMRLDLSRLADTPDTAMFYVEYDREPFFEDFLRYKEERLGNDQVPYVRYYKGGVLRDTSNFISHKGFLERLNA